MKQLLSVKTPIKEVPIVRAPHSKLNKLYKGDVVMQKELRKSIILTPKNRQMMAGEGSLFSIKARKSRKKVSVTEYSSDENLGLSYSKVLAGNKKEETTSNTNEEQSTPRNSELSNSSTTHSPKNNSPSSERVNVIPTNNVAPRHNLMQNILPQIITNKTTTQLSKQKKALQYLIKQNQARREVEHYNLIISSLGSYHTHGVDSIHWSELKLSPPPHDSQEKGSHQMLAELKLANYKPSLVARIFHWFELKKRKQLEQNVVQAIEKDRWKYSLWQQKVDFATKILSRDSEALLKVLEEYSPFQAIPELANRVSYSLLDQATLAIDYKPQSIDIIPTITKSLTVTGRLSIKKTGKSDYYRLYQNYICSTVLRIARDIFALLPIEKVVIHVMDRQLNKATGYNEEICILAVIIHAEDFKLLQLEHVEPSEAMGNFKHRMKFMVTSGFKRIERFTT